MDSKEYANSTHHEKSDGNGCDGSSGDISVRIVRQQHLIDAMNVTQSSDANAMLVPPEADSPRHILMAFCNDLLYEVFMRLHFLDLLNVAKVCTRFQGQAHAAFASKYKSLMLDRVECDQEKMESILCEFGSSIRSLIVSSNSDAVADGALFRAIIQNCTTELTELDLVGVNIQVESPQFRLPFPKLEELWLCDCEGNIDLAHFIDDCPELKSLYIQSGNLKGVNGLIDRKFEKLEWMDLIEYHGNINDDVFERFITLNPQLIKLFFRPFSEFNTSRTVRLIGQNLLKLEVLQLNMRIVQMDQSDLDCLGHLRALRSVWLNMSGRDVAPLLKVLVQHDSPIRSLDIIYGSFNENTIRCISQLKQLERLGMHDIHHLNDEHMIGLARNLPNLEELTIYASYDSLTINGLVQMLRHAKKLCTFKLTKIIETNELIINMDDYSMMLNIIRERPGKSYLRMKMFSEQIKLNVPEAILQENCDTFSIECKTISDLKDDD